MICEQPGEGPLQPLWGDVLADVGDSLDALPEQRDIVASDRDEHVDDRGLLDRVEPAHSAEVDEPERAVAQDEHVPWMRVGVEEAVPEHLVEHRAKQPLGEKPAIGSPLSGLLGIGDGHPFEPLLDEEPVGAEIAVELRDSDVARRTDEHRHLLHRRRLALEVELGEEAPRELVEHLTRANALAEAGPLLGDFGDERQRREVAVHHVRDVGPLDLHDDRLARLKLGGVGLTDRRGGERLPVEAVEDLLGGGVELRFEDGPHSIRWLRGRPVLQQRELVAHLGREQIDSRRRDLTELHVDAAGRFQHSAEAHTFRICRFAPPERSRR